jgi:hypothetical protein
MDDVLAHPLPSSGQAVAVAVPIAVARRLVGILALVASLFALTSQVSAEDLTAPDQRLLGSFVLLEGTPATRELRGLLDANRVAVNFVPMAPGVYARYSVARHVIEIDERWVETDEVTLAAVISHEATHVQDAVSGYLASGGASACIDSEVRAFRTSAMFWVDQYGRSGKPEPNNELERQLNSIADRQQRDPGGLEDLVRQTYSQQCSH